MPPMLRQPRTGPTSSSSAGSLVHQWRPGRRRCAPPSDRPCAPVMGKDSDLLPVLAHLMGMPPGAEGSHLGRMSPAELQHVTFAAVRSLLAKLVSRGPTVLALEDLHWSDPTSLRLTAELASLAANGPLLVLVTRRPELDPGVGDMEAALSGPPRNYSDVI